MVKKEPPDALKLAPNASDAHWSHTQRGLQNAWASDSHQRTHSEPGPLPREHCKHAGTSLPQHQTRSEHSVLSVRVTRRSQAAPDAPIGINPRPVCGVRCLTLIEPGTDSTPDTQAQHLVPLRPASGEYFSTRNSPASSLNFPPVQKQIMQFIFSKASNPAS